MALVNGDLDAQDIEVANILLQLQGNFQRPLQLMINQYQPLIIPLTNRSNNMNVLRVTPRPSASSTPKGSENIPIQNGFKNDDTYDSPELSNRPPKKRLNLYKRHLLERRRWALEKAFLKERALYVPQKVQTRDVSTLTKEKYFSPPNSEHIKSLYAELKVLREGTKKADYASVKMLSAGSGSVEEVQSVEQRERESTSYNETLSRVRYQRNAKANSIFCNGNRKAHIKEEMVSDNDSECWAESDEDYEDIEQKIEQDESEKLVIPEERTPQMNDKEATVPIGLGNARVPSRVLENVDWNGSYTTVTRKLLSAVFPRSVLATHSLTGKRSPAFPNKAAKRKLDPLLIEDIVRTVADRCNATEAQVRTSITTKCADESKMLRYRLQDKKKYSKISCSS